MNQKVKIELDPVVAMSILSFLMEFEEDMKARPDCVQICGCINQYKEQVCSNIIPEMIEDSVAEIKVAMLIGTAPDNAKSNNS